MDIIKKLYSVIFSLLTGFVATILWKNKQNRQEEQVKNNAILQSKNSMNNKIRDIFNEQKQIDNIIINNDDVDEWLLNKQPNSNK